MQLCACKHSHNTISTQELPKAPHVVAIWHIEAVFKPIEALFLGMQIFNVELFYGEI